MLTYEDNFNLVDTDKYNNLIGKDLWVACDLYECTADLAESCEYVYLRLRKTLSTNIPMPDYIEFNVLYDPEYWINNGYLGFDEVYRIFRSPERAPYDHIVVCQPLELLTTEELLEEITTPEVAEAVIKTIEEVNQENGWDL